jgi:hypothetical protein
MTMDEKIFFIMGGVNLLLFRLFLGTTKGGHNEARDTRPYLSYKNHSL